MHRASSKVFSLRNVLVGAGLTVTSGAGVLLYALENSVEGSGIKAHTPPLPWTHEGMGQALDAASMRRGYEVYKQVCAACHSLRQLRFRHFIDVFMTEEEAKAEAAEAIIKTLDDAGQPAERPGLVNDHLPPPYPNNKAAAAANNGAVPPDLSYIVVSRHGREDYLFSLLTGYMDAPAGVTVDEGKAYNAYFDGGVIAMPQQLYDEGIEYKDGTPATQSQQAKDVTTFLRFCAEPEHDTRKRMALKVLIFTPILSMFLLYWKRAMFTIVKNRKHVFTVAKGRGPQEPPSAPKLD
uniref:Cytochrome c domain-containing protein n=1 Tax=Ditylenchus dipsaci TaxID=166011 RepID=A0A915DY77_9BILA